MSFAFGFVMPVVPLFLQELAGHTDIISLAGAVFAAGGLVGAVSAAVMGRYSDRIGPRRVLVGGLFSAALFYLAQGYAESVLAFGVLVVLTGIATGAVRPVANSLITGIVSEGDRGKAFGVMSSAAALGWAAGPMAGGYLGAHYGFRSVFVATAILFLAVGAWAWFAMKGVGETGNVKETSRQEQRA
jgi:DHA1 family multidrug resistance protein-like MFS transporter